MSLFIRRLIGIVIFMSGLQIYVHTVVEDWPSGFTFLGGFFIAFGLSMVADSDP